MEVCMYKVRIKGLILDSEELKKGKCYSIPWQIAHGWEIRGWVEKVGEDDTVEGGEGNGSGK
jgi:hypothetical protein